LEFFGFIPENSLNIWYNKISVFEGFVLTVVEAMAAVTFGISTRVASNYTKA
jgi:hypothetical protein